MIAHECRLQPPGSRSLTANTPQVFPELVAAATMMLSSPDFRPGGAIPASLRATDCGGRNRLPALRWSGAPAATRSFALVLRDPDAPVSGGFYHWVLYDIPAASSAAGAGTSGRTGLATTGKAAYYGPCPPPGPAHHYIFTLYALDLTTLPRRVPDGPQLEARVRGHVLARATLEATAKTP